MRSIYYIICALMLVSPLVGHAAPPDASLVIDPQYPAPGDPITATLQAPSLQLQSTEVAWYIDGILFDKGVGKSSVELQVPSDTTIAKISARIGGETVATHTIHPTRIDLLWESDTFIPPFYEGRRLPADGSKLFLYVIPHSKYTREKLSYTWSVDGRELFAQSGIGRDTLLIDAPTLFKNTLIVVKVSHNGVVLGESGVRVKSAQPLLIPYPHAPLLGTMLYSALTAGAPQGQYDIVMMPYYFSIQIPENLKYTWTISGGEAEITHNKAIVQSGTATQFIVKVEHPEHLLQYTQTVYTYGIPNNTTDTTVRRAEQNTESTIFNQ